MDRYCSHRSLCQPTTGQVCLDYLRLNGRDEDVKECSRAFDFSSRPWTTAEFAEYHRRRARLTHEANSRLAGTEQVPIVVNRAVTASHQGRIPILDAEKRKGNTNQQLPRENVQHYQRKPGPNLLNLANEEYLQQQSLRTKREQREYLEVEVADQKRRLARMGLGGQQYHMERAIPQTVLSVPIPPEPRNYLAPEIEASYYVSNKKHVQQVREHPKVQQQQNDNPAWGHSVRKVSNDFLLNARASQEARQQKLAQQKSEEQNYEQEKVKLPVAKPGNLYPRPSRISVPVCNVPGDHMERNTKSDLALPVHLKSKMACQVAYRKYEAEKERKEEEQRKATLSVSAPEATRTESVKQLLTNVNKALEQDVEAAELEAAGKRPGSEAPPAQSQQSHQGQEGASQAASKCGEAFWHEYSANDPMIRQSHGTQSLQRVDAAPVQPLVASSGLSKGTDEPARCPKIFHRRKSVDLSRKSDYRAATEAVDKVCGDLLESPTTVSAYDEPSHLGHSVISVSRNREKCAANDPTVPISRKYSSVNMTEKDASPLPISQARQTDMSPDARLDGTVMKNVVEGAPVRELDIQFEWEEVDDSLGDEGWSDVEQDLWDDVRRGSLDTEWASDGAPAGTFDF